MAGARPQLVTPRESLVRVRVRARVRADLPETKRRKACIDEGPRMRESGSVAMHTTWVRVRARVRVRVRVRLGLLTRT